MEVMRAAYAKHGTRSQLVSNKTWRKRSRNIREYVKGKRASFANNFYFTDSSDELSGKGGMRHSFLHFVSLVRISEF